MPSRHRPLLVLLLILSLLFNGLNHALAASPAWQASTTQTHAHDNAAMAAAGHAGHHALTTPPCHDMAPAVQAPATHDNHCTIKDCLRACAQQPVLGSVAIALPPRLAPSTLHLPANTSPAPAPLLPQPSRPPIA